MENNSSFVKCEINDELKTLISKAIDGANKSLLKYLEIELGYCQQLDAEHEAYERKNWFAKLFSTKPTSVCCFFGNTQYHTKVGELFRSASRDSRLASDIVEEIKKYEGICNSGTAQYILFNKTTYSNLLNWAKDA